MSMQIKTLALYNTKGDIRKLEFKIGAVNIITGRSRTGKTALGSIIDYCLGRSKYTVPESDQFDSISWFGILYLLDSNEVFIAKPRPDIGQIDQSNAYIKQGVELSIPPYDELTFNTNDDEIKQTLSRLLGITPNLNLPKENETRSPLETNIGHGKFYLFQDQNLITDKEILFYRQKDPFMPQTIKDTLPYLLGAVPENYLSLIDNVRNARREFNKANQNYNEAEGIISNRLTRGQSLLVEAQQVGLYQGKEIPSDSTELLSILRGTQGWKPEEININTDDITSDLQTRIYELRNQAREIDFKVKKAKKYQRDFSGYSHEAHQQAMRLQSIELLPNTDGKSNICPVCLSELQTPIPEAENLQNSLKTLQNNISTVIREEPRLREYIQELETQKSKIDDEIDSLIASLNSAYQEEETARAIRDQNTRIARIVGRISLYLDTVYFVDNLGALKAILDEKRRELEKAQEEQNAIDQNEALESILNRISFWMTEWGEKFNLEHVEHNFRFSLNHLTVLADRPGSPIPMWRIGSAENWLGYHLITHMALHKHFVQENRPVPNFLILDQPSQVYFASENDYAQYKRMEGKLEDMAHVEHDAAKVTNLFNILFDFCEELNPNFQIIITEHANLDTERFQNALVEDPWTEGRALIPIEWTEK